MVIRRGRDYDEEMAFDPADVNPRFRRRIFKAITEHGPALAGLASLVANKAIGAATEYMRPSVRQAAIRAALSDFGVQSYVGYRERTDPKFATALHNERRRYNERWQERQFAKHRAKKLAVLKGNSTLDEEDVDSFELPSKNESYRLREREIDAVNTTAYEFPRKYRGSRLREREDLPESDIPVPVDVDGVTKNYPVTTFGHDADDLAHVKMSNVLVGDAQVAKSDLHNVSIIGNRTVVGDDGEGAALVRIPNGKLMWQVGVLRYPVRFTGNKICPFSFRSGRYQDAIPQVNVST